MDLLVHKWSPNGCSDSVWANAVQQRVLDGRKIARGMYSTICTKGREALVLFQC
jgi:hypothetical protein